MPSFPPRTETVKKQNQLSRREVELRCAVKKDLSKEKLIKIVEKYRVAHLSLLKAKMHMIREKELRAFLKKKTNNYNISKVESEIESWENKSVEEILDEFNR